MYECMMCHHVGGHDPMCPERSEHDRIVVLIEPTTELHPAGTRDKLAWYDDALKTAYQQSEALRTTLNRVYAERDNALDDAAGLLDESIALYAVIGELLHLLRTGAGDDSDEYKRALEVIGAVPDGDISAPDVTDERAEFAAHVTQSE